MIENVLIIYGVDCTDDLKKFGISIAEEFEKADSVFLIGKKSTRQIKYKIKSNSSIVKFIDATK